MEGKRKLAAILFTDIVGYSSLSHRDEGLSLRLLEEHNRLVRESLQKHAGNEIKTIGDAFLIEFESALHAVQCALEIQAALRKRNESAPAKERIEVRIGIHLGDVLLVKGDVLGDGVNIASRLQGLAPANGICVSGSVFEQVHHRLAAAFLPRGKRSLKGIGKPVQVYVIVGPGEEATVVVHRIKRVARSVGRWVAMAAGILAMAGAGYRYFKAQHPQLTEVGAVDRSRVAVLPFETLGADKSGNGATSDEYISDGMTEELISGLSRVDSIHVMARGSILQYKHTTKTPAQIAKELGIGTLVEGVVRREGIRLRISVQVIDGTSQESLWSQDYDGDVNDAFEIQKRIATRITHEFGSRRSLASVPVAAAVPAMPNLPESHDGEAYLHYLRGRYFMNERTADSLRKAAGELLESVSRDPKYAPAYAALSNVVGLQVFYGEISPQEAEARLHRYAKSALELDPANTEALLSLAENTAYEYRNWSEAEQEFLDAIASNPRNPTAHQWYAEFLGARKRTQESYRQVDLAVGLDPLSLVANVSAGAMRYFGGDMDEAMHRYAAVIDMDPDFMLGHYWMGRVLIEKKQFARAITEEQKAVELSHGDPMMKAILAQAEFGAGNTGAALKLLKEIRSERSRYVSHYDIALVLASMSDAPGTIRELRQAMQENAVRSGYAMVEPSFAFLRGNPQFDAILHRLN